MLHASSWNVIGNVTGPLVATWNAIAKHDRNATGPLVAPTGLTLKMATADK